MTNNPRHLRLLLVDRDPEFIALFRRRFRALKGYVVSIDLCDKGEEISERLFSQPFDLVFYDLNFPERDPLETLSQLAQTSLPLPVVALSQHNDARPAVEAMKRGVIDHLMKNEFATLDLDGFVGRLRETFRLKRENAELLQINQMKNDFLATISHELRTPLTSILGLSEILLAGRMGPLTEKHADCLHKVVQQSQNLAQLINQLLDVQDIVQERLRLDVRSVSLTEVVEEETRVLDSLFRQKGVALEFKSPPDRFLIQGDSDALKKVLEHVLLNALKFTTGGGSVSVAMRVVRPSFVEISVTDTGQGIPQEALPFVFQKFFHADASLTRAYGGLGLGLAYCKHVVERLNGRVWVESPGTGKGTRVNLSFPRLTPGADAFHVDEKTVLWVDDNAGLLELVEAGFASLPDNFKLLTCQSGRAALEMAFDRPPSLIVLDIAMPEMDGLEMLERLTADPRTRDIPKMIVSGVPENAAEAMKRGASDFMLKPFHVPDMIEKVKKLAGD